MGSPRFVIFNSRFHIWFFHTTFFFFGQALKNSLPLKLLGSILTAAASLSSHANAAISEASMHYSSLVIDCIANNDTMGDEYDYTALFDLTQLLTCISVGLNGKSTQGKMGARHCCMVLTKLLDEDFVINVSAMPELTKTEVSF